MPEPVWSTIAVTDIEVDDPFSGAKATPDLTSLAEKFRIRDCALKAQPVDLRVVEGSSTSATFVTIGSFSIYIPNYKVGLNIRGLHKRTGGTSAEVRAIIDGTTDDLSNEATTTSTSNVAFDVTIPEIVNNKGLIATFALQVKQTGGGTAFAKIDHLESRFVAIEE